VGDRPAEAPPAFHTRLEHAEWVLTAIDPDRRTVALAEPVADRPDLRSVVLTRAEVVPAGFTLVDVPVAETAAVSVDGIATRLDRLPTGLRVRLGFRPDRLTVTRITARTPPPPTFVYTVVGRDPVNRTITVRLRGTGEELADLGLAADAVIEVLRSLPGADGTTVTSGHGRFGDLTVGRPVALDLRVTPAGRPVITRVRVGHAN
jgi:hypothetical protein